MHWEAPQDSAALLLFFPQFFRKKYPPSPQADIVFQN